MSESMLSIVIGVVGAVLLSLAIAFNLRRENKQRMKHGEQINSR